MLSDRYNPSKPQGQTHDAAWPEQDIQGGYCSVQAPPWLVDAISKPDTPATSSSTAGSNPASHGNAELASLAQKVCCLDLDSATCLGQQGAASSVSVSAADSAERAGALSTGLASTLWHDATCGAATAAAPSNTSSSSSGGRRGDISPAGCDSRNNNSAAAGGGANCSSSINAEASQPLWSIRNGFNRWGWPTGAHSVCQQLGLICCILNQNVAAAASSVTTHSKKKG